MQIFYTYHKKKKGVLEVFLLACNGRKIMQNCFQREVIYWENDQNINVKFLEGSQTRFTLDQ